MTDRSVKAVRARKSYYCDDRRDCPLIEPGDLYVRSALFPGDITDSIWTHRLCASCAERYPETRGLVAAYGGAS